MTAAFHKINAYNYLDCNLDKSYFIVDERELQRCF